VWNVLCLVSLLGIGILIGKIAMGGNTAIPAPLLPEDFAVSNVLFQGTGRTLTCSFVPCTGNGDIAYTVTFFSHDSDFPGAAVSAKYENGICTAVFKMTELSEFPEYSVILNVTLREETRRIALADVFNFEINGYSWQSQWK